MCVGMSSEVEGKRGGGGGDQLDDSTTDLPEKSGVCL